MVCFCDANNLPTVTAGNLVRAVGFFAGFIQEAQGGLLDGEFRWYQLDLQ